MAKVFTVNEKKYPVMDFEFGTVVKFEKNGIDIDEISELHLNSLACYLSICGNMTMDEASDELGEHFINEGNFDTINNVIAEQLEKSRFFRKLRENAETQIAEMEEEAPVEEQKPKTRKKAE